MVKRLPKIKKEMKVQELIDIEKKYKERHNSVHLKLNQVNESSLEHLKELHNEVTKLKV